MLEQYLAGEGPPLLVSGPASASRACRKKRPQHAATSGLSVLAALVRSDAVPLRVVGVYRNTEVQPHEPLGVMLADLAHAGLAGHRALAPLTPEEVGQLLDTLLAEGRDAGARLPAARAARSRACGGGLMEQIRVLIADDHAPFRAGIRALLQATPDTEVVGEAGTGQEAVRLAARLQPDVILMDLRMPNTTGIEATRQILHTSPHIAILVLTMFEGDDSVFTALQAGARGYLLKGAPKAELLRALLGVASGEAIFGPVIAKRLMQFFAGLTPMVSTAFPELTERERELLALLAQHHSNVEIAQRLGLAPKTVRNHASNIFSKLQVVDRAQAIIRARDAGMG